MRWNQGRETQSVFAGGQATLARDALPYYPSAEGNCAVNHQQGLIPDAIARPAAAPPERSAVVSKAVVRAAELLGMTNVTLARTIGVSEATASHLGAGSYVLDPDGKPYELALLLVRLFRGLDAAVAGDAASLRSWMAAANLALGVTPQDLVQTATGLVTTVSYVDDAQSLGLGSG